MKGKPGKNIAAATNSISLKIVYSERSSGLEEAYRLLARKVLEAGVKNAGSNLYKGKH